ncbi:hypothetical protein Q4I30_004585 [Leishmania utingensis]|uniref:Uncharacterized protein n=1 Tax=Leishmania utingensis TaxID=653362 RepID=A0AAW3AE51_9TRYP
MPHALTASCTDRNPSPTSSSSTEQYHPIRRPPAAAVAAAPGIAVAAAHNELYHSGTHSYALEPDEHEDINNLTMPVPTHVKHQAASSSPRGHQKQQHTVLSPSRLWSPARSTGARAGQTTPSAVPRPSYHAASPPRSPPVPSSHSHASRTGIVNGSGYHHSTRKTALLHTPELVSLSPTTSRQPPQRRSPCMNRQSTSVFTEAAPATKKTTLLLPAPLNTTSATPSTSGHVATGAAAAPVAAVPSDSQPSSTAQWQLSSPGGYRHRSDGHVPQRGAVFAYASEAVNTLELQYGDALQRLNRMHRLYDRLDAHNLTLASELKRLRQVNDVLQNGVAFPLYNSVRRVKHEMKLLKQYVELLCSSFNNQLVVLQQVVGEELPRLLGRYDPYTSLLAHGAEGQLQPIETRVSIGAASGEASPLGRVIKEPCLVLGHVSGAGGAVAAGTQLYSPEYWWNAMSPHSMRPPTATDTREAPAEVEAYRCADVVDGRGDGITEGERALSRQGQLPLSNEDSRECNVPSQSAQEALVSRRAYQEVRAALADAQRRVAELEQATSSHQGDYENRIAQLKAAHRAKETTLKEELALLRRRAEGTQEGDPQQTALATRPAGQAGNLVTPVDVNELAQLLLERQYQQPTAKQHPNTSSTASNPASTWRPEDADETTRQVEGQCDNEGVTTTTNGSGRDYHCRTARPCAAASASASNTDDDNNDVRHSFDRRGADGSVHTPDCNLPSSAVGRVQRAREVLGCEQGQRAQTCSISSHHQREKVEASKKASATTIAQHSLAYDRLMGHSHPPSRSLEGNAIHTESSAARMQPCKASDANSHSVSRRRSRHCWQSTGGAVRDARHDVAADTELLQLLLAQVAAIGAQAGSQCAATVPKRVPPAPNHLDTTVNRMAQGIWAEKRLKERHYL